MTCRQARALLQPLLDGALSPRQERAARAHLSHCATCVAEYAALTALDHALAGEPRVAVSLGLAEAISRAAARRAAERRLALPAWLQAVSFAGIAAVAAVASLIGLGLLGPSARAALGIAGMGGLVTLAVSAGIAAWGALYYRA